MKVIVIALIIVAFIINLIIKIFHLKNKNIPENNYVSDIYDEKEYETWTNYQNDNVRLGMINAIVVLIITCLLFGFNIHSYVLNFIESITNNVFLKTLLAVIFLYVVMITDVVFKYIETFKIEEKYGFNKSNKKLFIKDQIMQFLLIVILATPFLFLLITIFKRFNNPLWFLTISTISIMTIFLLIPFVMPIFMRLFNKPVKLEEGELKDKILTYANKVDFPVENIYSIDASKRSTKANAYFSGYGKKRRIVLYDTLMDNFTDEEVVAILAHEVGHAKHKDFLRLLPISAINAIISLMAIYLLASSKAIATAFGFSSNHFFFGVFLFLEVNALLNIVTNLIKNSFSRKIEYKADKYSALTYSKEEFINALKKISKSNFANLFPHPLIILIYYSHPTLNQRITAIKNLG